MSDKNLRNIVIVGGGTAGWMAAATLGRFLKDSFCKVRLIEAEDIPTVGVGEATIPQIQVFNRTLGIDENEFIKRTQGTFKLGIEFVNWGKVGDSYIHAFGDVGNDMDSLQFYHYWWKMRQQGHADDIGAYSLNAVAAPLGKFMRSVDAGNSPLSKIVYAYQFDAGLYAQFLREYAGARGVSRTLAKIVETRLRASDGFIESVVLDNGEIVQGDLFIDCSGFQGLLIEKALNTGFEDWSHWLPCDRAWAVPCERTEPLLPYTRSTAHSAGWQWRIPLQHRTGNGHVFSSKFMGEDEAREILMANLSGKALAEPRLLKFSTGKRLKAWNKNCVAFGLSGGFIEPLESTSIHLVQSGIARLMSLFPNRDFNQHDIDLFNQQTDFEYERIRDFIILHYKATERSDSEFWNYCRTMSIPDSLKQKIDQFMENGQIHRTNMELFNDTSWLEVFHGQGMHPKSYHPLVDLVADDELKRRMAFIKNVIDKSVEAMPSQQEFIQHYCLAPKPLNM
ncbi:tryptophan halogenase family protein [Paraglaciecola hydrolytica]|uniref:Tryptophan halogenase n=1 Tax=Paraglaciecola hydrolytica TaxID=1799789 RepID=A0A148KL90_9ALTE|nr:tryptophan halogenase family protein [Paraglaciecola hydrolytica]KXI27073.1 tryptophan halogenase [Paraglaciecola hydrolytica]